MRLRGRSWGDLLKVQDQQVQALQRIERALGRLLNKPWNTARLYLTEAHQPGRNPEQVRAYLT